MKFLNKLSRKSPEEKVLFELEKLNLKVPSIMFTEKMEKMDPTVIMKVIQNEVEKGKITGQFIGKKGWFLFDAQKKLEEVWEKLNQGPIDLGELSTAWGAIGNKRVFIALEEFGKSKKMNQPIFTRKSDLLFLNSYIIQSWNDAVNRYDLTEMEITFDKILENMGGDDKEIVADIIRTSLKSKNSELLLGQDNIIRRRVGIENSISDYINSHIENSDKELYYQLIGEKFGIFEEEIAQIVLQLIDGKLIENITNYPTDGFIKSR